MVSGRSSGHRHRRQPTIAVTSLYLIPFVSLLLLLLLVPTPTAAFTGRTPLRRRFLQRSSSTVPTTLMEAGRSSSGDGQQPPLPPGAVVLTVGEIEGSLEPPPAPAAVGCGGELEEDPVAAAKRLRRARARQRRRQRKRQEAAEAAAAATDKEEDGEEDVIVLGAAAAVALSSASLQKEEEGGKEEKQGSRPKKGKGGMAATGATPPQQSAPRAPLKLLPHIQRKPTTWVYQRKGQHPNVLWRTISWAELRRHPCFDPLPHPSALRPSPSSPFNRRNGSLSSIPVETAADLTLFRQESWEWDALHVGRLTTSRVGSMLGFYEPQTAGILRVPRSLTSTARASGARAHLSQPPPPCYIAFLRSLQQHSSSSSLSHDQEEEDARKMGTWVPHNAQKQPPAAARPFLYRYKPPKMHHPRSINKCMPLSTGGVRMRWGSTQEATSVLAALNFLGMQGARIREAGLYPLEAIYPTPQALAAAYPSLLRPHPGVPPEDVRDLPPMGASPDGVVVWQDGTVEALEAKNHSPFRATTHRHNGRKTRGSSKHNEANNGARFIVSDQGPHTAIGPWHVAQLCWHMLCLGPTCRSALFVSASATKGVVLLRLRRDEAYLNHMLRWLHLFVNRYLGAGGGEGARKLDVDFFLQGPSALNSREERKEYRAFLEATLQLASSAELVARIPHEAVQRSPLQGNFFLDDDA